MINGQKWVHFLGICGRGSAGVASVMKELGWHVTGSDSNVYGSMPVYLSSKGIDYNNFYSTDNIKSGMDLVVVGGNTLHLDPNNPELLKAKEWGLQTRSWPELIGKYMKKQENVVIVGTYGKTTITSMIVKLFIESGMDPTYMIGDGVSDLNDHTYLGDSNYSVFEGDEHPTLGYSDLPKFSYFLPKYLIITSAVWDHFNIYKTEEEFVNVFRNLVKQVPSAGWILKSNHPSLDFVDKIANCRVYSYGENHCNYNYTYSIGETTNINVYGKIDLELETKLIGRHNVENIVASCAVGNLFGLDKNIIQNTLSIFKGPIMRLEKLFSNQNKSIYLDVGQHPLKAKGAIDAIFEWHKDSKLVVVLDPHASVYKTRQVLDFVPIGFSRSDMVIIGKMSLNSVSKLDRVTGAELVKKLVNYKIDTTYEPDDNLVLDKLVSLFGKHKKINFLFLSSGDFRGLPMKFVDIICKK